MSIYEDASRLYDSRPSDHDASPSFLETARSLIVRGQSSDVELVKRTMMAADLKTEAGVYDALYLLVGLTMSDEARMTRCLEATRDTARYLAAERCVTIIAGWPVSQTPERSFDDEAGRVVCSHAMVASGPKCRDIRERLAIARLLEEERARQASLLRPHAKAAYRSEFTQSFATFSERLSKANPLVTVVEEGVRVVAEGIVIAKQLYGIGDIDDAIAPTKEGMDWLTA